MSSKLCLGDITRSKQIETQHNYTKREQDKHIIKRKTQDV